MEGAKWDTETGTLANADTMKLLFTMPLVLIRPIKKSPKKAASQAAQKPYNCPLYYYPVRQEIEGKKTYITSINLKCADAPESDPDSLVNYWSKRGVAMLVTTGE